MNKVLCNKAGFTLIELLVAIVIIGVIAGIAVPRIAIGNIDKAKEESCKANIKQIETALEAYYLENGSYPDATAEGTLPDSTLELKTIPVCPLGNEPYLYEAKNENLNYELQCPHDEHGFKVTDKEEYFPES